MARRKRARQRARTTAQATEISEANSQGRDLTPEQESIEEAHARMAQEAEGAPPVPDEEIDAEVALEEELAEQEADALEDNPYLSSEARAEAEAQLDEQAERLYDVDVQPVFNAPGESVRPEETAFGGYIESPVDPSLFERGPLAAGIQILEAMLEQAKAGYIATQVDTLEAAIEENFSLADRQVLAEVASQLRSDSNLPDIAAAYRALVAHRAQP